MIAALWWLACAAPGGGPPPPDGPVAVRVAFDGPLQNGGGALLVQLEHDPAGVAALPSPVSNGLSFQADGEPRVERIGGRVVVTQRWVFHAPSGSYEIAPVTTTWTGPDGAAVEASSGAVFVDVGVPPPRPAEIADIAEPSRVRPFPWIVALVVGSVLFGGLAYAFRPRRSAPIPVAPPLPPDVIALAAWDAARRDPSLPLEQKAVRLAELFRVYVEAVLGFEATARTTREILDHLDSLRHLPDGNVPRAKRILRATDRVKFAEEKPGQGRDEAVAEWLSELDADLRGFVESTRPVGLSAARRPA